MNLKKVLISSSLSTLMLLGGVLGGYALASSNNEVEIQENLQTKIINSKGIQIRNLKTDTNADGSVVKTFTYEIVPSYATNKEISVSVKYKDGLDCSDVVTASVDNSERTISVKCLKDFAKQIILTASAEDGSGVTATMTIDYEKKITDFGFGTFDDGAYISLYDKTNDSEYELEGDTIDNDYFYSVTYSKYTINKNYTFKVESVDFETAYSNLPSSSFDVEEAFYGALGYCIDSESCLTAHMILSYAKELGVSEDDFMSYIISATNSGNPVLLINADVRVTCNQDSSLTFVSTPAFEIELNKIDWSSFSANVSKIELETDELVY